MAQQPRYCLHCKSYVAGQLWDDHPRVCGGRLDAMDRVGLVWDDDYLMAGSFEAVTECLRRLFEGRKSFLMVQHIGGRIYEIAFWPGGERIPELSDEQQGLAVPESGYAWASMGMYCRQWGHPRSVS